MVLCLKARESRSSPGLPRAASPQRLEIRRQKSEAPSFSLPVSCFRLSRWHRRRSSRFRAKARPLFHDHEIPLLRYRASRYLSAIAAAGQSPRRPVVARATRRRIAALSREAVSPVLSAPRRRAGRRRSRYLDCAPISPEHSCRSS